jgi:hypothetical protein
VTRLSHAYQDTSRPGQGVPLRKKRGRPQAAS